MSIYVASKTKHTAATGKVKHEMIALDELLDEMAEMAEIWKKNRDNGRTPSSARSAMTILAEDITTIAKPPNTGLIEE